MALAQQHTFILLTKRPARMRDYLSAAGTPLFRIHLAAAGDPELFPWIYEYGNRLAATPYNLYLQAPMPLANVQLGVSVENQAAADERIPKLLATPAAIRIASAEPLIDAINLNRIVIGESNATFFAHPEITRARFIVDALKGAPSIGWRGLDGVIVGGESGPDARPMNPHWARSLRDQCVRADVAFFFKQWGQYEPAELDLRPGEKEPWRRWPSGERKWLLEEFGALDLPPIRFLRASKKAAGRLLDGRTWNELP
jgi:protein gp37